MCRVPQVRSHAARKVICGGQAGGASLALHLGSGWPDRRGGGVAMRAINHPGCSLVIQEGDLLLLQSAFCGCGRGCTDVRRGTGEDETDPDVRLSECGPQLREGLGACSWETEVMPGLDTGVLTRGVTCSAERRTDDTAETRFQPFACCRRHGRGTHGRSLRGEGAVAGEEAEAVLGGLELDGGALREEQHVAFLGVRDFACRLVGEDEFTGDDDLHLVVGVRVHERFGSLQFEEAGAHDRAFGVVQGVADCSDRAGLVHRRQTDITAYYLVDGSGLGQVSYEGGFHGYSCVNSVVSVSSELFVVVRTVRLRVGDGTAVKSPQSPRLSPGRGSVNQAFPVSRGA